MLSTKDAQRLFRAGTWTTSQEADTFVQEAGQLPSTELAKMLTVLLDRAVSGSAPQAHATRCAVFAKLAEASGDPEVFRVGVRALRTADAATATMLVALLPKVNQVVAHRDLCDVLGVADEGVRRAAAAVLKQVAGKTAFEVLGELCREPEFQGRIDTMDVLVPKAGHHAIPLLTTILKYGKPHEKAHALKYLSDPRFMAKDAATAARTASAALDDPDERVVAQAITGMAAVSSEEEYFRILGSRLESSSPLIVKAILEGLKRYKSDRALEYFGERFLVGPNAIRLLVLDTFASVGDEKVVPYLVLAMTHRNVAVRTRASEIVSQLAVAGKVDPARTIVWLLRSRDPNVHRIAIDLITRASDKLAELVPKVLGFAREEDWWVRERVMGILVERCGGNLARHLVEYLNDPSDVIRRFAIGGLSRLKDPRTIGSFVRTSMNDTDWWAREQAIDAIAQLKDKRAVPYVIEILQRHPEQRLTCIHALKALGATDAVAHVAPFLADDDADVRLAAVQCLGELEAHSYAAALAPLDQDPVHAVRAAVREVRVRWNLSGAGALAEEKHLNLLDRLLTAVHTQQADDLVLCAGRQPYVKKLGKMEPLSKTVLTDEQVRGILLPHLASAQREAMEAGRDVDFSYEVQARALRFRGHVFRQNTGLGAVFRIVKGEIPNIEKLGLPPIVKSFATLRNGLVLIGGPTGSGKSTTLAAMIDAVNGAHAYHIVTIEDPIEVVHANKLSLINQREVGTHTPAFGSALRSTLRQDPDVLLVGELRDLETIAFAVSAAETGHLVFGTIHAVSADKAVERLINAFPAGQQPQVRTMLAETLRAVVCQHLIRRCDPLGGRALAVEVMVNNDAISNMIRKGKTFQIPTVIQSGRDVGMQSLDSELVKLVKAGIVSSEDAYARANDKKSFELAVNPARPAAAVGPEVRLSGQMGAVRPPRAIPS